MANSYDVIIAGVGPAGAAAASVLAAKGLNVLVLERDRLPRDRMRVGESLLPVALPVLRRIGVDLDAGGWLRKGGAEFIDDATACRHIYPFDEALPGGVGYAYQVERAPFDREVAAAAVRNGAELRCEIQVQQVDVLADRVEVVTPAERFTARYFIDATGQRVLMGRRERTIRPVKGLGRAASFTHYLELGDAAWDELAPAGNIKVLGIPDGWMWAIPLHGRKLSVGVVHRNGPVEVDAVFDAVATSPTLRRLTAGAKPTQAQVVGDFSFGNVAPCGPRWCCVGDAGGFIDPVFSSGVSLALIGATRASDRLLEAWRERTEDAPDLMTDLGRHMRHAYRIFHTIAHRFYNTEAFDNIFLAGAPDPELRQGLITVLTGDVWRDDNRFQNLLMNAARGPRLQAPWFEASA